MFRFSLLFSAVLVALTTSRADASPFTMNSPSGGVLPGGVAQVGGIVVDVIGANGTRVVSQLSAGSLYTGFADSGTPIPFRGNPLTIGIQSGFTPAVLSALGGGIAQLSVRITLFDGDTGPGNFDENQNFLQLNGVEVGNFSDVVTQETNGTGLVVLSNNPAGGFRNGLLDTGFFHVTNAGQLSSIFTTLGSTNQLVFRLRDIDPNDNFFDFTQGVNGGLINVGQGPSVTEVPEPATLAVFGGIALAGAFGYRRRKATATA
jgi:PEP-CTERM motif